MLDTGIIAYLHTSKLTSTTAPSSDIDPMVTLSLLVAPLIYQYL